VASLDCSRDVIPGERARGIASHRVTDRDHLVFQPAIDRRLALLQCPQAGADNLVRGRVGAGGDERIDVLRLLSIITIAPDPQKTDKDIAIPVLSPLLTRKKSLAEEIAELDVSAFTCPLLPRKQDDAIAKTFRYEGYDIITLQKLLEREYSIPEPQTAEEVIGYYARRIAQDVKLLSQFSALAPKVREFLETKAFGELVTLNEPLMVKAISSNVAQYVAVKTFVEALRKLVISELEPQLLHMGRPLSETPPFL
jgi:type III restriction enzyme